MMQKLIAINLLMTSILSNPVIINSNNEMSLEDKILLGRFELWHMEDV